MDTDQFLQYAMDIARMNRVLVATDHHSAARAALQEAHANLGQTQFFDAIDALGGHDAVIASIAAALESPISRPARHALGPHRRTKEGD